MSDPKPGDRVCVTYKATVGNISVRERWVHCADGGTAYVPSDATVEVLEPEWQHLDVVLDGNGKTWQRGQGDVWYMPGVVYGVTRPSGELTLIARDGKPASQS